MRSLRTLRWVLVGLALIATAGVAACGDDDDDGSGTGSEESSSADKGPIVIGAAIDQTDIMKFVDGPALSGAQARIDEINRNGGVDGRKLQMKVVDTQLDPERTRAAALELLDGGAEILWVTCDVDWSTPAIQVGIGRDVLAIAPCIGTDQMGPKRFGEKGKLAFSYGNVAQDEGAALAQLVKEEGWKTANVVADQAIAYTNNVCRAFVNRFEENGGRVALSETFTEGDGTIESVVGRVTGSDADVNIMCATAQKDLPAFVSGVRSAGDKTPIAGPWSLDGAYWLPKSPSVSDNIWFVTQASVYGDDPDPEVQQLIEELNRRKQPPPMGGFLPGAGAVDGIVKAIEGAGGSTEGPALAEQMEGFSGVDTISGNVSFSPDLHTVFGRDYRVMKVTKGKPEFVRTVKAGTPAEL